MTRPRRHTVTFEDDRHLAHLRWRAGDARAPLSWVLRTYGDGHWCTWEGAPCKYATREAAEQAGRIWDETGLQPSQQTPERIERIRSEQPQMEAAE